MLLIFLVSMLFASVVQAAPGDTENDAGERYWSEKGWGLGAIMRGATIPFATDEKRVASFVPMIFYQGSHLFFHGLEGGLHLYRPGPWEFSAIGRLHFFDIPEQYQNQVQGDTVDWGVRARYNFSGPTHLDGEIMTDWHGRMLGNIRYGAAFIGERYRFRPYAELKLKSKHYNSYYYGLDQVSVDADADLSVGFVASYHVVSNLHVFGAAKFTLMGSNASKSELVNDKILSEVFLGAGLGNDNKKPRKERLETTGYWRLAHGWATPSSLADILHFEAAKDPYNNQMTSIFYGMPLTNRLFGLPIDMYFNGGFVWHWKSEVQPDCQEVVANIKLYYTIPWPIRWRLGAAEGVSYVNRIPYVENDQLTKKGYKPSKILNYLDLSLDFNIGDITGGDTMKHWWLGYSIHHRSAIFETAQHYGRIKGGSNFQTVYLQWHY